MSGKTDLATYLSRIDNNLVDLEAFFEGLNRTSASTDEYSPEKFLYITGERFDIRYQKNYAVSFSNGVVTLIDFDREEDMRTSMESDRFIEYLEKSRVPKKGSKEFKSVYYKDGWLEVREDRNSEGWIAIDSPEWIEF